MLLQMVLFSFLWLSSIPVGVGVGVGVSKCPLTDEWPFRLFPCRTSFYTCCSTDLLWGKVLVFKAYQGSGN